MPERLRIAYINNRFESESWKNSPVFIGNQVDGNTQVSETSRTTDAVQVSLSESGEVKVDHHVHRWDVDASGEQVCANEVPAVTLSEVMKNAIPVLLGHARVNKKAGVAQFCDLASQKFHALSGVAEDNRLVDNQL